MEVTVEMEARRTTSWRWNRKLHIKAILKKDNLERRFSEKSSRSSISQSN